MNINVGLDSVRTMELSPDEPIQESEFTNTRFPELGTNDANVGLDSVRTTELPFDVPIQESESTVPLSRSRSRKTSGRYEASPNSFESGYKNRRRGGVYVAVLGVSMIVAVIAIGAIGVRRIERRITANAADMQKGRLYAIAAIEMGRLRTEKDDNWRSTYTSGTWESAVSIGAGAYSLEGIDPEDGDLADDENENVELIGTGISGSARQKIAATFEPRIVPLSCLDAAVAAEKDITITSASITCGQLIASNLNVGADAADVGCPVEAVKTISGGDYNSTYTEGVEPREMPDDSVFDYYVANGTEILYDDIDSGKMEYKLLSPNSNPYGTHATNPLGIYVIDCGGNSLCISNCRIVGTLVLIDSGIQTNLEQSVNWSTAVPNFPALMVDGSLELLIDAGTSLDEENCNFNPSGTPYNGNTDTDQEDVYPTEIQGLVYAKGKVTSTGRSVISGVILTNAQMMVEADLSVSYSSIYFNYPPPGFSKVVLSPIPGSWRRIVDE